MCGSAIRHGLQAQRSKELRRNSGTVIFASRTTSAAMLIAFSVFSKGVNLVSMNASFATADTHRA
jgi:hypothetical protein